MNWGRERGARSGGRKRGGEGGARPPGNKVGRGELVGGWRRLGAGSGALTARMTADGEFSNFIIDKDEKAVGSGAEPPG